MNHYFYVLCLVTQSSPTLCDPLDCSPPGTSVHGDSLGKNTGVSCHVLLQGIFPIQGLNPGLLHCRWIFYHLSYQGSSWILEWVAYPFSRRSCWPRNWTGVSCIAGRFFTSWATLGSPTCILYNWSRKWQPTPIFLPGESPWTEKPSVLQSMGSQRVRHDWRDWACRHPI